MTDGAPIEAKTEAFDDLLEFLKLNRGFDFTGYKRSSLERRIRKRMQEIGVETFSDYQDHLEVHPDEFRELFNTICINVTGFFRDKESWDSLVAEILPPLIAAIPAREPVRVWCAGCASGEEAYTTAIVLAEALGLQRYAERVKIYATDVDDDALATARQGTYPRERLDEVSPELVERYFEENGGGLTFRKDLRRTVIFGRNDLVQDAPISRIDLLLCRNTLMYFNAETQARVLGRFHFSLNERGFLFLGKSEMLITRADRFTAVSTKARVFRKVRQPSLRDRLLAAAQEGDGAGPDVGQLFHLREGSFDAGPVAQVAVDHTGQLVLANQQARALFGLASADLGRSFRDLELSYEELQSTVEELETTNEGLQSTNEELETTNEELQSTNEELETMNEELQSTNDELEAMNEDQRERASELDRLNLFLEGILGNLGVGVVVLDHEQRVQLWNGSASDLWGLRESEVRTQHFLQLDIGFPVEALKSPIRKALADGGQPSDVVVEAGNRRG